MAAQTQWWGTTFGVTPGSDIPTVIGGPKTFDQQTGVINQKKKKPKPAPSPSSGGSSTPAASTPDTSKADAAKKAEEQRKKRAAARAAAQEAKANKFNPLTTPFLSPSEIRRQAEDLANLGSTSEEALRAQGAQQVAGIGGLTDALASRLGAVNTQNVAGIAGMQRLYNDVAGQAQSAGTSAAAAAGVNPDTAPAAGASPMAVANMANLTAQTAGLVPAAGAIGLGLQAQAGSNLTKALVDRANRISSDTAKYLTQLQTQEYTKATGQQTIAQNRALLGLKDKTLQADIGYKQGMLGLRQQSNNIAMMKLQETIRNNNLKNGNNGTKTLSAAQKTILGDPNGLIAPIDRPTGLDHYKVTIKEAGQTKTVDAYVKPGSDPKAAYPTAVSASYQGPQIVQSLPTQQEIVTNLTQQLVTASNGTWNSAKARAWVLSHVPAIQRLPTS
jgi:hypothetical protein